MRIDKDDETDAASGGGTGQESGLGPYLALDRLLRYARSEALSQNRERAASLIEAAIASLADISIPVRH